MAANVRGPAKLELKAGFLEGLLGYRLRLAQQAVFRDFAAHVAVEFPGVSPGRVGILFLVEANPGVTQSRLAGAVRLDRSTLVGVLHVLQAQGLLERRRGEDRRTNGLWLTRAGSVLAARLRRRIGAHEKRVAARLSAGERARLLALLEKLSG
jgi:DNA-binding MarR family transcriptional regulator